MVQIGAKLLERLAAAVELGGRRGQPLALCIHLAGCTPLRDDHLLPVEAELLEVFFLIALELLASGHELIPDPAGTPSSPSRDWVFADGAPGKIGFIDSVSAPFCDQCNRVRLTADGKLRTCLFSLEETELLGILRDPGWDEEAADRELGRAIVAAVWRKEPGHKINHADFVRSSRTMSQIGG